MTGGLYMNANRWMSSNQCIGQTKIGLLSKYELVCTGCVYKDTHSVDIDLYFQWDP